MLKLVVSMDRVVNSLFENIMVALLKLNESQKNFFGVRKRNIQNNRN